MELDAAYWEQRYQEKQTGWDVGYAVTPLVEYFDQLTNRNMKILIPGAGNAYEVAYLFKKGFNNIHLLDFAQEPIRNFKKKLPSFPSEHLICNDFFEHNECYDLIIEHTFLTSIPRSRRTEYAKKMHDLLYPHGKLVGLLFDYEFGNDFPPFGGSKEEYESLFKPYFEFNYFEKAYNSIKPRADRELFISLSRK